MWKIEYGMGGQQVSGD